MVSACFRPIWMLGFCCILNAAQNSEYVGSKTCFGCHAALYNSYTKTDMGRSMRLAGDVEPGSIPASGSIAVSNTNRILRVLHEGGGWRQSESEPNVFHDEHELSYAIGSGENGLSFVVRRGDYLFQAPLSFYSKSGKWDLSPGYEISNLGFTRPIAAQCLSCHSGRPQPVRNRNGKYGDPPTQELAIGCENCHGPGGRHSRHPQELTRIVNPAKLPPRLAEDICMNCHQGGDARILQPGKESGEFRPGQLLIDTEVIFKVPRQLRADKDSDLLEHHSAMKLSRCFRESQGKLGCLTCHDPHVQPRSAEITTYFRAKCLTCHASANCRAPAAARQGTVPPDNCISCHMPKRDLRTISHSALTDHRIPARVDEPLPADEAKIAGGLVVVNEPPSRFVPLPDLTMLKAYGELADQYPGYQERYLSLLKQLETAKPDEPFVLAALGHKELAEGQYRQALDHLQSGLRLDTATADSEMAEALIKSGRPVDAVPFLKAAAEKEPYDATILKTLVLQYINLHQYEEARAQMRVYVELHPEDSFMRSLLARVTPE